MAFKQVKQLKKLVENLKEKKMSNRKKIAILGSTQYQQMWFDRKAKREAMGQCEVRIPCLDGDIGKKEKTLTIMKKNLELIKWADEIDFIWDARSLGAWGDFCMCFALGKKLNLVFLNDKTIIDCVKQYAEECQVKNIKSNQIELKLDGKKSNVQIELKLEDEKFVSFTPLKGNKKSEEDDDLPF